MSYVEVPAESIRAKLKEMGFERVFHMRCGEEVYERCHHKDGAYVVRVYSSISDGAHSARGCGQDAIRVVALRRVVNIGNWRRPYDWRGVAKTKRVHRTGTVEGVLGRMYERAREAYAVINEQLTHRQPRTPQQEGPKT